jgi:hypothetical protein
MRGSSNNMCNLRQTLLIDGCKHGKSSKGPVKFFDEFRGNTFHKNDFSVEKVIVKEHM